MFHGKHDARGITLEATERRARKPRTVVVPLLTRTAGRSPYARPRRSPISSRTLTSRLGIHGAGARPGSLLSLVTTLGSDRSRSPSLPSLMIRVSCGTRADAQVAARSSAPVLEQPLRVTLASVRRWVGRSLRHLPPGRRGESVVWML